MANFDWDNSAVVPNEAGRFSIGGIDVRPLMRQVYLWMGMGLAITGIVSLFIVSAANSSQEVAMTISNWMWPIFFGQIGIVFGLSFAIRKISPLFALLLFFLYSGLTGLTFGVIFYALIAVGDGLAIAQAFFTTAGLFGVMTVIGYTTKVDLSKYSTFFMMALIGLIIAIVVNLFLGSSMLDLIISVAGVLIFTALTAWDTQKIKNLAALPEYQQYSDDMRKLAVMGALTLYLDFINLFLFLLRLFAGGRD